MQPMSFEAAIVVEDWVTGIETFLEDDTNSDWTALDALSVNTMLLRPSSDEMEELVTGNDCFLDVIVSAMKFLYLFIYLFFSCRF